MCRALLGDGVHTDLRGLVNFLLTSLYISRQFVILLPFRLCCKSYAGDKRERGCSVRGVSMYVWKTKEELSAEVVSNLQNFISFQHMERIVNDLSHHATRIHVIPRT